MTNEEAAIQYFGGKSNSFCRWSDQSWWVIESKFEQKTILFRNDLEELLQELDGLRTVPFEVILLVVGVANNSIKLSDFNEYILKFPRYAFDETKLKQALQLLRDIEALPDKFKTGEARVHLLSELLLTVDQNYYQYSLRLMLGALKSGSINDKLLNSNEQLTHQDLDRILTCLSGIQLHFPDSSSLKNKLVTGIANFPQDVITIETKKDQEKKENLLEQLLENSETSGIAELAKYLHSALSISGLFKDREHTDIGGVSDISNKGRLDQLIHTEWAYEDLMFMNRVINKEALYIKRDDPPSNNDPDRIILVDTSLLNWGTTHKLMAACVLAFVTKDLSKKWQVVTLQENGSRTFELSDKESFFSFMEVLSPCLETISSASDIVLDSKKKSEILLLSGPELIENPGTLKQLGELQESLSHILLLGRTGELSHYAVNKGLRVQKKKLLLDLEATLYKSKPNSTDDASLSFLNRQPAPLLMPITKFNNSKKFGADLESHIWGIDKLNRLIVWHKNQRGAIILKEEVPNGKIWFGRRNLLITGKDHFYHFQLDPNLELTEKLIEGIDYDSEYYFKAPYYLWTDKSGIRTYNTNNWELDDFKDKIALEKLFQIALKDREFEKRTYSALSSTADSKYSVYHRIERIGISPERNLVIGTKELIADRTNNILKLKHYGNNDVAIRTPINFEKEKVSLSSNHRIKCTIGNWASGSKAIVDGRGMVHLIGSKKGIHDVTFLTVLNTPTAAWADDVVTGNDKFWPDPNTEFKLDVSDFYDYYIQPFIDQLT